MQRTTAGPIDRIHKIYRINSASRPQSQNRASPVANFQCLRVIRLSVMAGHSLRSLSQVSLRQVVLTASCILTFRATREELISLDHHLDFASLWALSLFASP